MARKNTLPQPAPATPPPVSMEAPRPIAVVDMGASAIRLVVAEAPADGPVRVLEEVSRGVLLGNDTFTLNSNAFSSGTVDGGFGNDTLVINVAIIQPFIAKSFEL